MSNVSSEALPCVMQALSAAASASFAQKRERVEHPDAAELEGVPVVSPDPLDALRPSSTRRGIGEPWRLRPAPERLGRQAHRIAIEPERRGVRHLLETGRRNSAVRGIEHVSDRQGMTDDEQRLLRSCEQRRTSVDKAESGRHPTLAAARTGRTGLVLPRPLTVQGESSPIEGAEADLVEKRLDEPRDIATGEREIERLLGPQESGAEANVDWIRSHEQTEQPRLLPAAVGEPSTRRSRAHDLSRVRLGVRVPREDERPHSSTER